MAMNPLPPQAYTKDTLLQAYAWLQNQNNSIKEMATTPDILVSLFMKTMRDGEAALDRPSIQNFKNELKSLAGLMGELEKGQERPPVRTPPPSGEESPMSFTNENLELLETLAAPKAALPPKSTAGGSSVSGDWIRHLDPLSCQILNETKIGFNLSNEGEALRLLIKLGHLKARKILDE